ncbi:Hsp70 family protein [Dactylosporangium sp. CA-092794]|uniref:Hsp70 family protein n=1 Tax=Dactylosporangium sp. CA-092794 TaxID=3239929 RepID=UPI003D8D3438
MTGVWCVDLGGLFTKAAAAGGIVPIEGGLPDRPHLLPPVMTADGMIRPRDHLGAGPTADGACIVAGPEGPVLRSAPGLCAVLLGRAHDALRARYGGRPDRFVLTHPGRWRPGSPRLDALREAARIAGLPPVDLLAGPLAMLPVGAARGVHLVCDLGATGEIAVVRRGVSGRAEVLAAWSDGYAGGDALDRVLHRQVVDRLRATDPDVAARYARADELPLVDLRWDPHRRRLAEAVTAAREHLTSAAQAEVLVTWPGGDRTIAIGRNDFAKAAAPLVERTTRACRALLEHVGVPIADVRSVVTGGGASATPATQDALAKLGPPLVESVSESRPGGEAGSGGGPKSGGRPGSGGGSWPCGDPQLAVVLGGAAQPVGAAAGSARAARNHGAVWEPAGVCPLPAVVRDLAVAAGGRVVAVTDAAPVWCDFAERPVVVRSGRADEAGLLALSPDRRAVVTGPVAGRLRAWNGHGDRLALIACGAGDGEITAVALAADGSVLVVRAEGALERWRSGVRRWRIPAETHALVVTGPDGGALVGGPGGLRQIDGDGAPVRRLDPRPVTALAGGPSRVVIAYGDEVVVLDLEVVRWTRRTDHPVTAVAIDPGGAIIAGVDGTTVRLWNGDGDRAGEVTLPEPVTGLALAGDELYAGQAAAVVRYRRSG